MKKYFAILCVFVALYISYFSFLTITRYRTLYSSYFDLGIMHQTVYNTFRSIKTGDFSRFLELTNPHGYDQIKRMAIHNDILLAVVSLFYFIYAGPETLLILQSIVLGLGAFALFGIAQIVLKKFKYKDILSLLFAISYLFFPPLQRANVFDFHAVTLATSLLLFMFYFFLKEKKVLSFLFFVLAIFSKEEVALTTAFFGIYILWKERRSWKFGLLIFASSIAWFFTSMLLIIPLFRSSMHFALTYYSDFGDSPVSVIFGIFKNPANLWKYIWHIDTFRYFLFMLGPTGFLSLFSLPQLLIALPEFAINLLSNDWNMRNIVYHYTSVITPFVFISSVYGVRNVLSYKVYKVFKVYKAFSKKKEIILMSLIIISTVLFSYFKSPLPYSVERDVHPFLWPQKEAKDVRTWKNILSDKRLKIMATGQIAPLFAARRYVYLFSPRYDLADYVVLSLNEIYNYPDRDILVPVYEKLTKDPAYMRIYKNENVEVYRKKI